MKVLKLSATLALLGVLTLGMAETTVDEQIAAIQSASDEERVELMNEFKENLSTLSEEDRAEAISQLRSNVDGDGEHIRTHTRTRTRDSDSYMQHSEDGQQLQQQLQQQNRQQMPDTNAQPTGKNGQ